MIVIYHVQPHLKEICLDIATLEVFSLLVPPQHGKCHAVLVSLHVARGPAVDGSCLRSFHCYNFRSLCFQQCWCNPMNQSPW